MIAVTGFRLTGLAVDMRNQHPVWTVTGYYITGTGRIFSEFLLTSDANQLQGSGFGHFIPNSNIENLTSLLMNEAHNLTDKFLWGKYEQEEGKKTEETNGLNGDNASAVAC